MNVLNTASSATNLTTQQFNDERISETFSNGRSIKESPPQQADNISSQLLDMLASDFPISKKNITKTLADRMPETTASRITITDSGQKLDMETAWGEIEHYLTDLIGLSPEHLQEAHRSIQELTVNKFEYLQDLVDHLVANLNEQEGTQYPLTDEIGDDSQTTKGTDASGKLYSFTKFTVAALAGLSYMTPTASASSLSGLTGLANIDHDSEPPIPKFQNDYKFFADYTSQISVPDNDSPYTLKNYCDGTSPVGAVKNPEIGGLRSLKNNATITGGDVSCLPENMSRGLTLAIPNSNAQDSISVSTGYGFGNLKLSLSNGRVTDPGQPIPGKASTAACAIIKNPDQYWSYLTIKGNADRAVLAVDFNTGKCRTPFNFGVGSERPKPVLTDTCATEKPLKSGYRQLITIRKAVCLPSNEETQPIAPIVLVSMRLSPKKMHN